MSRALIAGAGIGGLTAALALAQRGVDVVIFERSRVLEEFGAGLQLSPNATRVLRRLSALDAVAQHSLPPRAIHILRGRDGADLAKLPLRDADARWGAPFLVLHRANLQRALVERAARQSNISLRMGAEIGGFAVDEAGVSVGVRIGAVGTRERGDLLVGADGLRSIVRERLGLGEAKAAKFLGRVAFRALVDSEKAAARWREPEVTLRLGARAHLVHYPLPGRIINLVAVIESGWREGKSADLWDGEADLASLDRAFAKWSPDARALIALAQGWRAWPLYHRPPLASFAAGRIALLGDAAHPMPPFLAQGAAQAIEDAGALGEAFSQTANILTALANYSSMRVARANRVQREAIAQAKLYHMAGPLALARDLTMRTLGPRRLLGRYDWLYGG
jgi:salicylate hydroxylase